LEAARTNVSARQGSSEAELFTLHCKTNRQAVVYSLCVDFEPVVGQRVPVWAAVVDKEKHRIRPPISQFMLPFKFPALNWENAEFRGVGLDRLPTILATGVDVEPTTAPIWVSTFEKAWEYGGLPKVVMAFDGSHLERLPDTSANSPYEVFARWIPGDPFDALLAVFVFKLEGTHCG
jgi:hypothetical protein